MKKTKKLILLLTLFILCFAGCTSKTKVKKERESESETKSESESDTKTKSNTTDQKHNIIVLNGVKLKIPKEFEVSTRDNGIFYIDNKNLNFSMILQVYEERYQDRKERLDDIILYFTDSDEYTIVENLKEIDVKGKKYAYYKLKKKDDDNMYITIYTAATNKTMIEIIMYNMGEISDIEYIESIHTFLSDIESTKEANTTQKEIDDAKKEEEEESKRSN